MKGVPEAREALDTALHTPNVGRIVESIEALVRAILHESERPSPATTAEPEKREAGGPNDEELARICYDVDKGKGYLERGHRALYDAGIRAERERLQRIAETPIETLIARSSLGGPRPAVDPAIVERTLQRADELQAERERQKALPGEPVHHSPVERDFFIWRDSFRWKRLTPPGQGRDFKGTDTEFASVIPNAYDSLSVETVARDNGWEILREWPDFAIVRLRKELGASGAEEKGPSPDAATGGGGEGTWR